MVNQSIIEILKKYLDIIPKELGLKKAFLFGSYASGNAGEHSDIDIALILSNRDDFFKIQLELMKLRRGIDLRIEPHPIFDEDFNVQNPIAFEIQRSGIELVC